VAMRGWLAAARVVVERFSGGLTLWNPVFEQIQDVWDSWCYAASWARWQNKFKAFIRNLVLRPNAAHMRLWGLRTNDGRRGLGYGRNHEGAYLMVGVGASLAAIYAWRRRSCTKLENDTSYNTDAGWFTQIKGMLSRGKHHPEIRLGDLQPAVTKELNNLPEGSVRAALTSHADSAKLNHACGLLKVGKGNTSALYDGTEVERAKINGAAVLGAAEGVQEAPQKNRSRGHCRPRRRRRGRSQLHRHCHRKEGGRNPGQRQDRRR